MKEKITQNDSTPVEKCISDLNRKNVQIDAKELREQFEDILYKHDVWYDYFHWWAVSRDLVGLDNILTKWEEWTDSIYPELWMSQAFLYEITDRPITLWALCTDIWNVWLYKANNL